METTTVIQGELIPAGAAAPAQEEPSTIDKAIQLADRFRSYAITTPADYANGAKDLAQIKALEKAAIDERMGITRPLDESKKKTMALYAAPLAKLEQAKSAVTNALRAWDEEQERKVREAEEALREAQRKEAARLAKLEADARARAEAAQAAGNGAKAATDAAKAEEFAARQETVQYAPVFVPSSTPKVDGHSSRTLWKARVVNADLVPREYMMVNEKALNRVAEATKGALKIPGVEIYSEKSYASRG